MTQTYLHTARQSFCLASAGINQHVPFLHGLTSQSAPAWLDAALSSRLDTQYASRSVDTSHRLLLLAETQRTSSAVRALPDWHLTSDRRWTSIRGHPRLNLHRNTAACADAVPPSLVTRDHRRRFFLKTLMLAGRCCSVGVVLLVMM